MRPRAWAAVLIFLSGYSPLLVILCVRDFDFQLVTFKHPRTVIALLAVAALSVILVFRALRSIQSGMPIRILSARSRATDLVNYSLPYIVSFFGLKLDDPHDMISLVILMALLFVLAFRTKALFINPILACAGYQLLEAEYEENGHPKLKDLLIKGELKMGESYNAELLSTNLLLITSTSNGEKSSRTISGAEATQENQPPPDACNLVVSP
jgi:hypothetical protein